jgi:methylthioribose-1-phosphate isomerase
MIEMLYVPSITFNKNKLKIVDQTKLPARFEYISLKSVEDTREAIKTLKIRGAPAIGIVVGYCMYLEALKLQNEGKDIFIKKMDNIIAILHDSRPTAVNLVWAINRIKNVYQKNGKDPVKRIVKRIKIEACKIHEEDREACYKMGINGLSVVTNPCNILTHCNTGSLATGGWGTALGVIYAAREKGYTIHVYVTETRPLGQGARLTFWELMKNNIPSTLITDSAAGSLMSEGKINLVLFGADRIARNGDVANKIGSCSLAVLAKNFNIPCYAVAPLSTFDFSIECGKAIPIEYRNINEILAIYGYNKNLPPDSQVLNPAFDITRAEYLSGIITENMIIKQPIEKNIRENLLKN